MSAVMFTGASQFALVGVLAAGGSPLAGLSAALLLGLRNTFYGVPVTHILRPRGVRRLWTAHFVIDETTAMAVGQPTPQAGRYAFWATAPRSTYCGTSGSLAGALIGGGIDTTALGLDAAAPAIFLALLWPQLARDRAAAVALGAAVVALALVPLVPARSPDHRRRGRRDRRRVSCRRGPATKRRSDDDYLGHMLAASLGCYGLKLAGVSLPASVLNHPRVQRTAGLLPVAMLTALVVTDLFDANGATAPTGTHSPGSAPAPSRSVRAGRSLSSFCSRSSPRPSCD